MELKPDILHALRSDFPILAEKVGSKALVYFDNAATTQKPRCVVEKISEGYYRFNANIHRGVHHLSRLATEAHEAARRRAASFLNAARPEEIIFTRGTTEAINLLAFSFGEAYCRPGDEIVITEMEHHANIVPWQMLCERKGLTLRVIPIRDDGSLNLEAAAALLNERSRLLAVTHVSNVLGTINPIVELVRMAHDAGAAVLVDGAQAVAHLTVDVQALDVDFYTFSSHKVYGPTGIGILYGKVQWLDTLPPYQGGGEMISKVSFEQTTYNEIPFKFEAGTPDYIGSTALAEALRYLQDFGIKRAAAHEDALLRYATEAMEAEIPNLRIFGKAPQKSAVLSFLIGKLHPYDLGMLLDSQGFALRSGHHCAQPLMQRLGLEGCLRASFAFYNSREEIDQFIPALKKALALLDG